MRRNDGTGDVPFSISVWFKLNSTSAVSVIFEKYAAGKRELDFFVNSSNQVNFRLGNGTNEGVFKSIRSNSGIIVDGAWHHVVVTYDGVIANSSTDSFAMYVDGVSVAENNASVGAYPGVSGSSGLTRLGAHINSSGNIDATSDVDGNIYAVGIWRRQLSSAEVSAIYSGSRSGGLELNSSSGFISRSPRLMLRELDDLPGSYSTVRRTGDPTRTGALSSNFNDATSIVFSQSGNIVFPTMLPKGSSFASQAVDIIGQESDISASLPIRSFQQPNHLHYSPTENVGPFNENRSIPATDFFLNGTDPDIVPGFSAPARSKIILQKSIVNSSEFQLGIGLTSRGNSADRTGVAYFNFDESKFEYKGLNDPSSRASSISFDICADLIQVVNGLKKFYRSTGSQSMVQMFVKPENQYDTPFYDDAVNNSYVGLPTISAFAPADNKYYATSSQLLKMSDLIRSPFLLEKISIEVSNAQVQRSKNSTDAAFPESTALNPRTYGVSSRLQDNYVFFLGRQFVGRRNGLSGYNNSSNVDAAWEVSSSIREIFATASACFYNLPTYLTFSNMSGPTHSPAFSHNFNSSISKPLISLPNPDSLTPGQPVQLIFAPGGSVGPLIAGTHFVIASGQTATNIVNAILANPTYVSVLETAQYTVSANPNTVIFRGATPFSSEVTVASYPPGGEIFATTGGGTFSTYSGSINLEFYPTTAPPLQSIGLRSIPNSTLIAGPTLVSTEKITLQFDAFPGGLAIQDIQYSPSNYVLTASIFEFTVMAEFPTGSLSSRSSGNFFSKTTTLTSPLELDETRVTSDISSRAFRKFGGENSDNFIESDNLLSYIAVSEISAISPYILMPHDEIFFGVDAGISVHHGMDDFETFDDFFMRFTEGSQIKVTLFGSEIKNDAAHANTLNQDLSSNSVHEIIGAEPLLDQFQIEPVSSYYGSYLDEIVTGSMANPILGGVLFSTASQDQSRRVISRVSLGQAGTTGSFQRFSKISDSSERTYDSCLPSYSDFFSGSTDATVRIGVRSGSYIDNFAEEVNFGITTPNEFLPANFFPNQFPFQRNPVRKLSSNGVIRGNVFTWSTDNSALASIFGNNMTAADHAFRVGYSTFYSSLPLPFDFGLTHRSSDESNRGEVRGPFRYGISNTKPEFSSCRWKSDHFGHFRDILEPRQLTALFDAPPPVKARFVSGSTAIDPMLTYSQNLSTFATSSMPYFDDSVARNRPDNPDESLVQVIA